MSFDEEKAKMVLARLVDILPVRPARRDEPELLDRAVQDPRALADNLADLRRVNRWLGGNYLTIRALNRLTTDLYPGDRLSILDVATGAGDIPRAVVTWAIGRGFGPSVLATDVSPEILAFARRGDAFHIDFAVADAREMPFADASFDVVLCSLAIHHLSPSDAVCALREMRRVARWGIVINDLIRNWLGYAGSWLLGHTLTRNPLTRHDAPLSVRRAYTREELAALAAEAGLGWVTFDGFLGYRVAMTIGSDTAISNCPPREGHLGRKDRHAHPE